MRKAISFVLSLALVFGMIVISAPKTEAAISYTPTATELQQLCSCGCGGSWDTVKWKKWDPNLTGGKPISGHYYLDADYTHSKQYQVDSGVRVVIDLRGHKLTTEKSRLFLVYGYTAILDSVGGGLLSAAATGSANGGAVMVAWDGVAMNDEKDATFEMFHCSATLETGKSALNGGIFSVNNKGTLKAEHCKIFSASALERAGAIYATSGSVVALTDTEIYGCSAVNAGGAIYSQGSLTLENCRISGCKSDSYGGGIYKNAGSLTVKNTVLENNMTNAAQNGGGNLYAVNGSKVSLTSSTVRGGYAAANGGNLFFGNGSFSLVSCTISGGVALGQGNNLYCADSSADMALNSCTVSGDVSYAGQKVTLKNTTKISLNNTGLVLGDSTQLVDCLTEGAEVFTNIGSGNYLKPVSDYCPHCSETVTWTAMGEAPTGHCYLTADLNLTEAYAISADTVVDLRGFDITSADRAFTIAASGSLTVLDSVGGGTVTGSGNADGMGGVYQNAGSLTIWGGKHVYAKGSATVATGGVVHNENALSIHGGVLDGSQFHNTASTANVGGTVCNSAGSRSFTMSAGYLLGGTAYAGGTLRISESNRFDITGGAFLNGTAGYIAGNIHITGSKTKPSRGIIRNALISGGVSNGTSGAGNLFVGYCAPDLIDSLILNGSAPNAYGGNVSIGTNGDIRSWRTVVLGGSAPKGGNLYSASYLGAGIFTNCQFLLGQATGNGGNLFLNHGNLKFIGGQVSYGRSGGNGGNIYNNAGNYSHADAADDGLTLESGIVLSGGIAVTGGNLYNTGDAFLTACRLVNGQADKGRDLYYADGANGHSLTVGEGMTGTASVFVAESLMGSSIFGGVIENASATVLNVELSLEGQAGTPILCVSAGQLCVGGVSVKTADSEVWHPDVASAIAACPENGWVKLYMDSEVVLTRDCRIDLNGRTVTVSGNYTLYGMDSSGDDFSVPGGKAVWETAANTAALTEIADRRYVALVDGSTATYHRLEMTLTDVSLRTESCGIYYKGAWGCDSVLAPQITQYGIAVSLQGTPGAEFATIEGCVYSSYDGTGLQNGEVKTGMLIKNIMRDNLPAGSNERRGQMPIYASAYVTLADGTVLTDGDGVAYSLRSTMEEMDRLIVEQPMLYLRDAVWTARDFYTKWREKGMNAWQFHKLKQPEDDGVLKILILGSSRSVNTFQLLYQAFKDQLPEQEFVMGVMYYSGCSMTMHERFIKNSEAVYHYYRNDGGDWSITPGKRMEEGLHAENWDVVLLQAGTGDLDKQMQLETRNFLKSFIDDHLIDPYALWWHSTWFNSTDPELYKPPKTAEDAAKVDQVAQLTQTNEAAKAYVLNDPMFAGHITSGTPMMYALKCLGLEDKDLFRDHTHLSDFGCMLVAYAFYAQYTGNPVTEINLDKIPVSLRHKEYQHLGDMEVTAEMKQIIIDTVAYTLNNPWSIPGE